MQIIAQNAGGSAGQVYSALISSGQLAWDKEAFPAQIEALRAIFVEGVIETVNQAVESGIATEAPAKASGGGDSSSGDPAPACPECGGEMWDNRQSKRNPKAPDFKCKDKSCDTDNSVIWPPRGRK